jgi:ABC-type phosphate/phosphonate transport system substrate-binding protein
MTVAFLVGVAGFARAGGHDFVVEHAGTGGTAQQAQSFIDQFLRYSEETLKWPANSATGEFYGELKPALAAVDAKKPGFAMIDPELYLALQGKHPMTVIAFVYGSHQTTGHYNLAVKDPALKTVGDLKGKTLASNHLEAPKYLSKVAFDGKIDVATHFKTKDLGEAGARRGMKLVDRGEADATLLNDEDVKDMQASDYGKSLRVVWTSDEMLPLLLVAFDKNTTPAEKKAFGEMVLKMCNTPNGGTVCKNLDVTKFTPPDEAALKAAVRRYSKP